MPHPRFRITGQGDEYTFNLTAANGEKILSSERMRRARGSEVSGSAASKRVVQVATGWLSFPTRSALTRP